MTQSSNGDLVRSQSAQEDEISLVHVVNAILRHWRMVLALPLSLAVLVGGWTFLQDRTYSATASFVPQAPETGAPAGAAALAAQFGVSLGGDSPAQTPQFYVDLLQSLSLLRAAVETEYTIRKEDGAVQRGTLIDLLEIEPKRGMPAWRVAVEELWEKHLSTTVGRETGVVRLTTSATHPALAEQIAQRLLELLGEFNIQVRQNRAKEESEFIGARVEEARSELVAAEGELKAFLTQNRGFANSPELLFEHERLQRQVAMRQEVYTSLVRAQEQAQIDAVRDTPLFSVVDHPAGTAEPEGRGTILRALIAFTFGLATAVFIAIVKESVRQDRNGERSGYQETGGLARAAWEDLRRPSRWIRRRREPLVAEDH